MDEILIGIDFGTTNTVVTYFENNKANILLDAIFKIIPSKIGWGNDKIYCGNHIPINCDNIIINFKTTIGEDKIYKINNKDVTNNELLIIFFNYIYNLIKKKFQNNIISAIITVPSNFSDKQREIIKASFESVNINVIRIINEPSAAALAYGLNYSLKNDEKILVVDTGGGTMDFTILEKLDSFFEVKYSTGLNNLGGNNFTDLIENDIIKTCNLNKNKNIWNIAQTIKEKLTYLDSYRINIDTNEYTLYQHRFFNMAKDLIKIIEETIKSIMTLYDFDYVILVGGSSRIPFLQEVIKNTTNLKPWLHPNLEYVVAEGAGLYAGIIKNKFTTIEDVILLDVVPLSLGVELADGTYSIMVPKGTPLPISKSEKYTITNSGETSVNINIYQGERIIANKNILVGEILFDKITQGGVPIIEIKFKIDINSIINITVIDRKSGCEKNVIIKNFNKISSEEVNKIIENANNISSLDNEELIKIQNIYLIKTYIENALSNIKINELINMELKKEMLDYFTTIESELNTMNNLKLIETVKHIEEKYVLMTSSIIEDINIKDCVNDIEKVYLKEKKLELEHRIKLLFINNSDLEEYLNPVLEKLTYNNITIEYINEKLKLLDELNELEKDRNYKDEFHNLCLYVKKEIELGDTNFNKHKNQLLVEYINNKLNLLNDESNIINWEKEIDIFNELCDDLYNS